MSFNELAFMLIALSCLSVGVFLSVLLFEITKTVKKSAVLINSIDASLSETQEILGNINNVSGIANEVAEDVRGVAKELKEFKSTTGGILRNAQNIKKVTQLFDVLKHIKKK